MHPTIIRHVTMINGAALSTACAAAVVDPMSPEITVIVVGGFIEILEPFMRVQRHAFDVSFCEVQRNWALSEFLVAK